MGPTYPLKNYTIYSTNQETNLNTNKGTKIIHPDKHNKDLQKHSKIVCPLLTSGKGIGFLFKPKFQYFELPHRKYKSFKRIKVEDLELKNFISNRNYNNPADKDLTHETSILRGGMNERLRRSSQDLQLPSCFGFTPKTKV